MPAQSHHFDYTIVGAGSAGCLIARQLAIHTGASIALIEAGPGSGDARTSVPAYYLRLFGSRFDWGFATEPQSQLAGRRISWPRGKLVGGCGATNALIYLLPHELAGLESVSEQTVGSSECPFSGLPLSPLEQLQPACESFLEIAEQIGWTRQTFWTSATPGTCGPFVLTRHQDGSRAHVGQALSQTQEAPDRLSIFAGHEALRVEATAGAASQRVHSVITRDQSGLEHQFVADSEVIISCGAIGSPALLLASGLGKSLPSIGQNLQDHLVYPIIYQHEALPTFPRRFGARVRDAFRRGHASPMHSNVAEAGGVFEIEVEGQLRRFQIHCTPTHYLRYPRLAESTGHLSLGITPLQPRSCGRVSVERDGLKIGPAYLSDASDWQDLEAAVACVREQFSPKLNRLGWTEIVPGKRGDTARGLRRSIAAFAQSIYHPTGTCREAPLENGGVVDSEFRVHSFDNLRICDASTFPTIPASNTQAPTFHSSRTLADLLTR